MTEFEKDEKYEKYDLKVEHLQNFSEDQNQQNTYSNLIHLSKNNLKDNLNEIKNLDKKFFDNNILEYK